MKLVLKKKCAFVDRIEVSSVLFELCISLQTNNRTSNKYLNISFLFSEIKKCNRSLGTSATKWMNVSWRGGWKSGRQTDRILHWNTAWKDTGKTQIQRLSRSEFCRAHSWCFSSYTDWEPCNPSSSMIHQLYR